MQMLQLSETRDICEGNFGHNTITVHTRSTTYFTYTRTFIVFKLFH
jgi:hypothetical protein